MIRILGVVVCFLVVLHARAQLKPSTFQNKNITIVKDTISLDSISISPVDFKVFTSKNIRIPPSEYAVDFANATLVIFSKKHSKIRVEYHRYPEFVTKVYSPFDKRLVVENTKNTQKLYSQTTNKSTSNLSFFNGLETKGFIVRGLTGGNNQNAVTNASLDLSIQGKLSEKIGIRANIFDTNFPLQQGGYSQNITDFDRIFVELFTDTWNLNGGDIRLENRKSYFLNFNKQISGVAVTTSIGNNMNAFASGAIVRGKFSSFNFIGVENNQGPYKILGPNNEPAIVIIDGSDQVFVNGILLERGENKDYIIDYNLAEIRFTTTFPITNDMRIRVEFQYSDRNYTRFITYDNATYTTDKFSVSGYFYNENDAKNQPIQQSLTEEQKQILADAGNDPSKMVSPSAYPDVFSEDRIQYKKTQANGEDIFVYTNNSEDTVYTVTFSNVGANNGDYAVEQATAIGTIYSYVGKKQGGFSPVVQLIAPDKLQVAVIQSSFQPSEHTTLQAEIAYSNKDANLFSTIGDAENHKMATKIGWKQSLATKAWEISNRMNYKFIEDNFQSVQRFQAVEFARDWNLNNPLGNQQEFSNLITAQNKIAWITYGFEHLSFSDSFKGNKHRITTTVDLDNSKIWMTGSWLQNTNNQSDDSFFRLQSGAKKGFQKSWFGAMVALEANVKKNNATKAYDSLSHKFKDYEIFYGLGDSTKVFAKFGVNFRENDSVRGSDFTTINSRKTIYIDSKLIQNKTTNLGLYANFRRTNNVFSDNESSLHSRLHYQQLFFADFLRLATNYETTSGSIPVQDFIYVKTEPGQGYYTWIDYNNDGLEQFNEFEIAQFQDQALYLRLALPNTRFQPTQKVKWRQSLTLNPKNWKDKNGRSTFISNFYNQTNLNITNERSRTQATFHWNPFQNSRELLSIDFNFRNNLYFNRNKENYSWVYTYGKTRKKQQYAIGIQENKNFIHQVDFQHRFYNHWLFDALGAFSENSFIPKTYAIEISILVP
ncbi:hypothetical protein [Tenacibaculum sp. SG-28]|uniref:hypothetical protein n=1 Tax=Tenacibaculum sp. SG-28 TaxID=754426 RepID=UPI000CF3D797|nr:hypothetical protein [Tenacibaculum sp. SG-28]PQJ21889.1 hypothetical protein BSU00_07590 [Tenacibaculum sp. SG-28]